MATYRLGRETGENQNPIGPETGPPNGHVPLLMPFDMSRLEGHLN